MKKIILTSVIAASSMFAVTNDQILGFYNQIIPQGVSAEIVSREKLENHPDFEGVIIKLSDGKVSENEIVFTQGDLLLPDVLDLKTGKSYKNDFKEKMLVGKLAEVYNSEKSENIIKIGNDSKKPTKVVFSDPECPYCRNELANIEKVLEKENLKIILTPVHDRSALEKSYLAYKDTKTAKSDSEKVKILRKYFAEKFEVPAKSVTDEQIAKMDELRKKYLSAGLRSVPFYIDEAALTKK
ncbi:MULTISPECIES: thioredoxin domain-containing protein [Campylobacter]|uniref:thioredoxin domain-containing protein n=1 Tax=Campylobacter TaxID=194 RepID=UPI001475E9ED|nr:MULTISPECIES: thioredoxin domain-containing protein [unclassified Campylobacter]MBE3609706.1 thioredoxin domain-containing protein [Campylobacter sp. RM12916]